MSEPTLLLRLEPPRAEESFNGPLPSSPPTRYFPAGPEPLFDLCAVLRNTAGQGLQTFEPVEVLPVLTDARGGKIDVLDARHHVRPMPQFPHPPAPILQPGEERVVCRFPFGRAAAGRFTMVTRFGNTELAAGPYSASLELTLRRIAREDWVRRHAFAGGGPGALAQAEQAADGYAAYWAAEAGMWWGALIANALPFELK